MTTAATGPAWRARWSAWPPRHAQFAIMTVWIALQTAINSASVTSDLARHGIGFHAAEPWIWESSGGLAALLLLWPVLAFDDRLRARWRAPAARAVAYLAASIVFSVAHVTLMVAMRQLVYRLVGWHYDFGPWLAGLVYEYRKDAFSFLLMVAGAAALRRLRGWVTATAEPPALPAPPAPTAAPASPAAAAEPGAPPPAPGAPPTFLVRTTGGDLLVRASEVDWVEAQGNYVALHVGGEVRLLRQTLADTEARLKGQGFVRTHRRALVNQARITAILPSGPGEPGVRLRSGALAPLSESRRPELMRLLRGD